MVSPSAEIPSHAAFGSCIAQLSTKFHVAVKYECASHFWSFQVFETAIFIVLALALVGACFWSLRPGPEGDALPAYDF